MPSEAEEIACLREALERSRQALGIPERAEADERSGGQERRTPVQAANQVAAPPELGSEQITREPDPVREAARSSERTVSTIAAFRPDARGLLMMRLENGQLWQQTEQPGVPVTIDEDERNTVEISRSGFGGYRMRLLESGRTMVVKRVQ